VVMIGPPRWLPVQPVLMLRVRACPRSDDGHGSSGAQAGTLGTLGPPEEERITLDTDFADMRTYPPGDYPGLIVLRMTKQDKPHVLAAVTRVLPLLGNEPLVRRLWLVGEDAVRIRGAEA